MCSTDGQLPLQYTPQWIALGIVTLADIRNDEHAAATSDDPCPEHYRWRAFCRFLSAHSTLSPELARQLYALGDADADISMGGAVMADIIRRPDCPLDLLQSAFVSERAHLRRLAARRLQHNEPIA